MRNNTCGDGAGAKGGRGKNKVGELVTDESVKTKKKLSTCVTSSGIFNKRYKAAHRTSFPKLPILKSEKKKKNKEELLREKSRKESEEGKRNLHNSAIFRP